jgi:hypothetical protein
LNIANYLSLFRIAVCVKGLIFLDESEMSSRWIMEWLELQWALGADSISIYTYWIPDKVRRILDKIEELRRSQFELVSLL